MSDLDDAVRRAKVATVNLIGLMFAYGLTFQELGVLLSMPPVIARAYEEWAHLIGDVAKLIARQDGIPPGTVLTYADRHQLTVRAYTMVMD